MNVIGIGTDICDCNRIGEMIRKHGSIFLDRVYTAGEQSYCSRHKACDQHYAGRWAAKESILKALGTGWAKGIRWTDLEVFHLDGGKPQVRLHGAAEIVAEQLGIREMMISISHSSSTAIAFVIAVGGENDGSPNPMEPIL